MGNKGKTRLTDLEINEVSYVKRGAIGEVFSIIKSEDGLDQNDVGIIEKVNPSDIGALIQKLPDAEFVSIMGQMLDRYDQINKDEGGTEQMDENQVIELVKTATAEIVGAAMDTVNKNFVAVNKTIDEIQKKVAETLAEDPNKGKTDPQKDPEIDELKKSMAALGDAVKTMGEGFSALTKSLEGFGAVQDQIKKMSEETLPEIAGRVEAIEKQETPANGIDGGDQKGEVKKSGAKWPSFMPQAE